MSRPAAGLRRWVLLAAALAASLPGAGSALLAQGSPDRVEFRTRAGARFYDNFFRVSRDSLAESIFAWTAEARATVHLDRSAGVELYGETEYTRFETLGASPAAGVALVAAPGSHWLRLRASYQKDRPAFDVGDVVRTSDIVRGGLDYSFRPVPAWELGLEGRVADVSSDTAPPADSRLYGIGGSVRYRGLGYRFQPEVGGRLGWRRTEVRSQEYSRSYLYARIVSIPVDGLWTSLRYRFRARAYPEADPASSNFGRSDDGGQWTVLATYRVAPPLRLDFRYNLLDMESTLPRGTFTTQVVSFGMAVLF